MCECVCAAPLLEAVYLGECVCVSCIVCLCVAALASLQRDRISIVPHRLSVAQPFVAAAHCWFFQLVLDSPSAPAFSQCDVYPGSGCSHQGFITIGLVEVIE